jgi:hypothetical protein
VLVLGREYAAYHQQAGWEQVEATCLDQELKESGLGDERGWEYRLLCRFTYQGQGFLVTPESSHLALFNTAQQARDYLERKLDPDGRCLLWIDPKNPLHAVFDKALVLKSGDEAHVGQMLGTTASVIDEISNYLLHPPRPSGIDKPVKR